MADSGRGQPIQCTFGANWRWHFRFPSTPLSPTGKTVYLFIGYGINESNIGHRFHKYDGHRWIGGTGGKIEGKNDDILQGILGQHLESQVA